MTHYLQYNQSNNLANAFWVLDKGLTTQSYACPPSQCSHAKMACALFYWGRRKGWSRTLWTWAMGLGPERRFGFSGHKCCCWTCPLPSTRAKLLLTLLPPSPALSHFLHLHTWISWTHWSSFVLMLILSVWIFSSCSLSPLHLGSGGNSDQLTT